MQSLPTVRLRPYMHWSGIVRSALALSSALVFLQLTCPSLALATNSRHTLPTASTHSDALLRALCEMPFRWMAPARVHSSTLAYRTPLAGVTIPILMTVTPENAVGGVDSVSVTVKVDQVGDSIQLGVDKPWLVNSPSYSWPLTVAYPAGGTDTRTVTLTTNASSSDTPVTIYACRSGVDASNPANWSVAKTIVVKPLMTIGPGQQRR